MERTLVEIQPVNYSATALTINNVFVALDQTAQIGGGIYGEVISLPYSVNLTTEEYNAWGSDDNYIIDLVLTKLNLQKKQ